MPVAPRKAGLLQAGGLLRKVAGRGLGGSSSGSGACRFPPALLAQGLAMGGGVSQDSGDPTEGERIWAMPCTDGTNITQQAHEGWPYNPAAAEFLIAKLNYCKLSDNFQIHGINMEMFWQCFHHFPDSSGSEYKHVPKTGKFHNSGFPRTPWTSAQV